MKKYYFDYAATTPLDPGIFRVMKPYFACHFGNPSNLHRFAHRSKIAISGALEKISSILNCSPQEFIFTSSATESNNTAILGVARANKAFGNRVIVTNIEHKSVLAAADILAKEGFEVIKLKVDKNGLVSPQDVTRYLNSKTILVSVIYANNEVGTVQPIAEISAAIQKIRISLNRNSDSSNRCPLFHTDATQAISYLDIDTQKLGVDLMTLSAHKIYGPKGIGGLYIRKGVKMQPLIIGGGQQNNLRSGTENVPAIVGFGEAVALAENNKKRECRRIRALRNRLEKGVFKLIHKVILNGHPQKRLPNFLNVSILDIEGEAALLYLDRKGIAVSTGSACHSQTLEPSYVISALDRPYEQIHGSLRFSLGKFTTKESVDYVLRHLPLIVKKLRQISPVNLRPGEKKICSMPEAFVGNQMPHFTRKK